MKTFGERIIKSGLFILLLLCLALPALPAMAGSGINVGPASIDIKDAMRGSKYEDSIIIFNTGDQDTDYQITVSQEAAAWVSLSYQGKEFSTITIPSGGKKTIDVTVAVPGDAANGNYTARVMVTSMPGSSSGDMGMGVSLAAYSDIHIAVTGTQHLSGKVGGISAADQETGFPLLLLVFFENTGNVAVSPSIDVTINWAGNKVDSFNYSDTKVGPSQKATINVNWDTTGHTPGDYTAHVVVNLDDQQISTQDLNFKILALGSLTRSGELGDVSIEGSLLPGKLAKINGVFANTGNADVLAKLTGEIYYDNNLLQRLEGDEVLVNRGIQTTLSAYFTPDQEGKYTVKAQVDFGGKKTDVKEFTFNIGKGQANPTPGNTNPAPGNTNQGQSTSTTESSTGKSFNMLYPILGGAGLVVLIIVVVWMRRRD